MARTTVTPNIVRLLSTVTITLFAMLALAAAPAFAAPAAPVGPGEVVQPVEPPKPEPNPAVDAGSDKIAIPEDDPCWEWGNCPPPPPPDPEECNPFVLDCDNPVIVPCEQDCGPDDEPKDDPKDEPQDEPGGESSTGIPTPTRIDTGAGGAVAGSSPAWWFVAAGVGTAAGAAGARRYLITRGQR